LVKEKEVRKNLLLQSVNKWEKKGDRSSNTSQSSIPQEYEINKRDVNFQPTSSFREKKIQQKLAPEPAPQMT